MQNAAMYNRGFTVEKKCICVSMCLYCSLLCLSHNNPADGNHDVCQNNETALMDNHFQIRTTKVIHYTHATET